MLLLASLIQSGPRSFPLLPQARRAYSVALAKGAGMPSYAGEHIQGTVDDAGVLHLRMNRAPVNAAHGPFILEIGQHFSAAKDDNNVKAIVLSSAFPKIFTAGLDLKASSLGISASDPARTALRNKAHILSWQDAISQIELCDKPVIAAVSGIAYGLAVDICCACDIRYASADAQFSIKEVDVGLAADIGTLSRIHRITGNQSLVRELAYTARPFDAREAQSMGFVSRVIPEGHAAVIDAALTTARLIASKSPIAVLGTKHLLNYGQDHTVAESLYYTAVWNSAMLQAQDLPEAMQAFLQKKTPRFSKL